MTHPVKSMSASTTKALQRVRRLCLAHAGAIEKLSHGEPCFFTKEKGRVFVMFDNHHHGAEHIGVWLPTPAKEAQESLVAAAPSRFFIPPYVGYKGWVGVVLNADTDWNQLAQLIAAAFEYASSPPLKRIARRAQVPKRAALSAKRQRSRDSGSVS